MYGADSLIIVILQHIANLCRVLRIGVKLGSIYLLVTIIHSWLVFRTRAILHLSSWTVPGVGFADVVGLTEGF